jgi:hypothetical protein
VMAAVAANGPDFDTLYYRKLFGHRGSPFHVPFNWFLPLGLIGLISIVLQNRLALAFTGLFAAAVLSHFIMDSMICVDYGIRWLAPYSQKYFGIILSKTKGNNLTAYVRNNVRYPVLLLDVAFWIIAIIFRHRIFHV